MLIPQNDNKIEFISTLQISDLEETMKRIQGHKENFHSTTSLILFYLYEKL